MRKPLPRVLPSACGTLLATWLLILAGCGERDAIRRYQVPHEAPRTSSVAAADAPVVPQRLLGAIIAGEGKAWFVKLLGPSEQVAAAAEVYDQVVQSLRFPAGQEGPTWTAPPDWTERGADENRFATLEADGLEIAISQLPWDSSNWDEYLLANLNRWRRQVQLPPIAPEQLADAGRQTEIDGRTVFLVDLTGETDAAAGASPPNLATTGGVTPPATAGASLEYDVPEGWVAGKTSAFRIAAFDIQRDGKKAELTVIPLGVASGSLLENVNRWRGQIGLGAIDQAELDATVKSLEVDGVESSYVELGPSESSDSASMILAVVVPRPDQIVFIKLLGDHSLVVDEKPNFERFVQSLRFPASP